MQKVTRPAAQWRQRLSPLAYKVTRRGHTEPAFSHDGFPGGPGRFRCVCCGLTLFDGRDKFDSGTGWPSFTRPVEADRVGTRRDWSMIFPRTEVHCARCDAHLGHVFRDGPPPTGLRYCLNGVALDYAGGG